MKIVSSFRRISEATKSHNSTIKKKGSAAQSPFWFSDKVKAAIRNKRAVYNKWESGSR